MSIFGPKEASSWLMDCFKASIPILKVLCDETRLSILSMLSRCDMNGCEITRAFCFSQPTISYHMKQLVDAQLVIARKELSLIHI